MTSIQTARLLLPRPNHQTHGCSTVRRLLIYTYYIAWGIHRHCHWIFSASWHSLVQQYVISFGQALCLIRLPSISTPSDPTREQEVLSTKWLCLRISLINSQQSDISTILLIYSHIHSFQTHKSKTFNQIYIKHQVITLKSTATPRRLIILKPRYSPLCTSAHSPSPQFYLLWVP